MTRDVKCVVKPTTATVVAYVCTLRVHLCWSPSASPSLLMFRIDRHIARIRSSLVLYRVPRNVFFYFGKEIVIARTHIGWIRWMFQNVPLPVAQEIRDSSCVTPCIVVKNDEVYTTKWCCFLQNPCDYDLFAKVKEPLGGIQYNTRDKLIRAIGRSIRNISKDGRADGVRRLPKILQRVIKKRTTLLKVHKCGRDWNKIKSLN